MYINNKMIKVAASKDVVQLECILHEVALQSSELLKENSRLKAVITSLLESENKLRLEKERAVDSAESLLGVIDRLIDHNSELQGYVRELTSELAG